MKTTLFIEFLLASLKLTLFSRLYFLSYVMQSCIALVKVNYFVHSKTIYSSSIYDFT